MSTFELKANDFEVIFDEDLEDFEISRVGDFNSTILTFNQIEQLYTWAASVHERERD